MKLSIESGPRDIIKPMDFTHVLAKVEDKFGFHMNSCSDRNPMCDGKEEEIDAATLALTVSAN